MTARFFVLFILFIYTSIQLEAQYGIRFLEVPFQDAQGNSLANPTTGGLNNPQFSEVDMDGDGDMDLYILDRAGGKTLCFLNDGNNYIYAPEYIEQFPIATRWALLRDYNCDGIMDMFMYNKISSLGQQGIQIFKGSRDADNKIQFDLINTMLHYQTGTDSTVIAVSNIDLPDINDIDGDGDLDILTFNLSGGYIDLFHNESQELGYACDSLIFRYKDDCWGRFYESGVFPDLTLSPSRDSCALKIGWTPRNNLHAGSTLLSLDTDADGDKDLLLGDVFFDNLLWVRNAGDTDTAFIDSQLVNYPSGTLPVELDVFPAAFYLDVDYDGIKDLLVSPNAEANSVNKNVVWFYKNNQANNLPSFSYQTDDFLSGGMIDHGAISAPTFMDYNGDGLLDIVVGNYGYFEGAGTYRSQLQLYKNIGTATQPSYKLEDADFAQLEQYDVRRLCPTFGDLDNDGDLDGIIGQEDGTLIFIENKGSNTAPSYPQIRPMWENIDVGLNSAPQLVDVDEDGDLDLIVGERNGNFNYFQNDGDVNTADFNDTPTSATFGFIDTKTPGQVEGNAEPCLVKVDGEYHFFTGLTEGWIWNYDNVEGNILGTFNQVSDGLVYLDEGDQSVVDVADINQDGNLDFVVGNVRGGISFYSFDPNAVSVNPQKSQALSDIRIYPNPSKGQVYMDWANHQNQTYQLSIHNVLGQTLITQKRQTEKGALLSLEHLPNGIYTIQVLIDNQQLSQQIILLR
ncbi:MAG: T9SS type A sorting domain-containing protein [Saprospiraceae bacterium]|nr:T9SS type A sorting domain-containing protein [Saprospiraceae bacterium]